MPRTLAGKPSRADRNVRAPFGGRLVAVGLGPSGDGASAFAWASAGRGSHRPYRGGVLDLGAGFDAFEF